MFPYVENSGPQTVEAVGGVDVVLDDVECKVVEAAEAPDGDDQEEGKLERRVGPEEVAGGEEAGEEEESCFDDNPARCEVGHEETRGTGEGIESQSAVSVCCWDRDVRSALAQPVAPHMIISELALLGKPAVAHLGFGSQR